MELPDRLRRHADTVGPALEAALARIRVPALREAAAHYPRAGGKRLRPALAMACCESAGGRPGDALSLALSVELLHDFSLVHDDLMDRDDQRRGVPTVHVKWGDATAILAGDALYALAFEVLADVPPTPAGVAVVADVAATARVLCEGQALDMAYESSWPTAEEYWAMIRGKTARLFRCATENGARLAGAGPDSIASFAAYGEHLGLAFQLQDDLLDMLEAADVTGKPRGSDLRAGKKTLPVLLAHERADAAGRRRIEGALGDAKLGPDALEGTIGVLAATGALDECRRRARAEFDAARRALQEVPDSPARKDLEAVLDALEVRRR